MMVSVQRIFEGTVFQAKVMEEERIGMRGQGDEDILVEEARMILEEGLRATEVAPDLKVISFEAKMLIGGINNKGFLLQRWQLESEGTQQVDQASRSELRWPR